MIHTSFCSEEQLRRRMLFRLLKNFDFDAPVFRENERIESLLPRRSHVEGHQADAFCLAFVTGGAAPSRSDMSKSVKSRPHLPKGLF
jgi:hypothetical protein